MNHLELTQTQENDVYTNYIGQLGLGSRVKVMKIKPASDKHVKKYARQQVRTLFWSCRPLG